MAVKSPFFCIKYALFPHEVCNNLTNITIFAPCSTHAFLLSDTSTSRLFQPFGLQEGKLAQ